MRQDIHHTAIGQNQVCACKRLLSVSSSFTDSGFVRPYFIGRDRTEL